MIAVRIEKTPTIVVAQAMRHTRARQQTKSIKHPFQSVIEIRRNGHIVDRGQQTRMQKHIKRVNVVIRRPFEVKTVPLNLSLSLLQDQPPATRPPALGGWEFRTGRP